MLLLYGAYLCLIVWKHFFPKQTFLEKKLDLWTNISIVVVAVRSIFYRNSGIHPWKKLAASTHLQFVIEENNDQDNFLIRGKYRGYDLTLQMAENSIGVKSTSLSLNRDVKPSLNYQEMTSQEKLSTFLKADTRTSPDKRRNSGQGFWLHD